ncbi:MAG TPA: hypothetical protein VMB50_12680, partial [Myxococcales bacterium]|nr:hypothetical protein [Myxococcales bacterium]
MESSRRLRLGRLSVAACAALAAFGCSSAGSGGTTSSGGGTSAGSTGQASSSAGTGSASGGAGSTTGHATTGASGSSSASSSAGASGGSAAGSSSASSSGSAGATSSGSSGAASSGSAGATGGIAGTSSGGSVGTSTGSSSGGTGTSGAGAAYTGSVVFSASSVAGMDYYQASASFAAADAGASPDGGCSGGCCFTPPGNPGAPPSPSASAGSIALTDNGVSMNSIVYDADAGYYAFLSGTNDPALFWSGGDTLAVSAAGDPSGVAAFSGSVTAPVDLAGINPTVSFTGTKPKVSISS